jgi:hypothetical protein
MPWSLCPYTSHSNTGEKTVRRKPVEATGYAVNAQSECELMSVGDALQCGGNLC